MRWPLHPHLPRRHLHLVGPGKKEEALFRPPPAIGRSFCGVHGLDDHDSRGISSSWVTASQRSSMGTDLTAIVISSVFLGVGFVIAKFFPEAALLAAVFLVGLAILNIALVLVG